MVTQRKFPRFAVQLPVEFKGDRLDGKGTILNISREGCMLTADRPLEPATYLQLSMHLIGGEDPVRIHLAAVRWMEKQRYGLEFIKISSAEMSVLSRFVEMLASYPGQK